VRAKGSILRERLLTERVWDDIGKAVRDCEQPIYAAVAYFGRGGARRLPLKRNSRLIVNADSATVSAGQTCPRELGKLVRRGVRVYGVANLHAKIIVTEKELFVGSANVSRHSAQVLQEAVLVTRSLRMIAAARRYARGSCLQELGPKELVALQKLYRAPKLPGIVRRERGVKAGSRPQLAPLKVAQLEPGNPPEGSDDTQQKGLARARTRMRAPRRHELSEFFWNGQTGLHVGDSVIEVFKGSDGRTMVSRPGQVVYAKVWRRGRRRCTFFYAERARGRNVDVRRVAKAVGRGARAALERDGRVSPKLAFRMRQYGANR
jgi:hypothetical protein